MTARAGVFGVTEHVVQVPAKSQAARVPRATGPI